MPVATSWLKLQIANLIRPDRPSSLAPRRGPERPSIDNAIPLGRRTLCINLHLVTARLLRQLHHTNIIPNLLLLDHLLIKHRRRTPPKLITLELLGPLVRLDEASVQRRLLRRDHRQIDITSRAQIIPDARLDRLRAELHRLLLVQLRLPLRLKDRHGRQRAGAHGHVGELVGGTVRVHGKQVGAGRVDACDHQVRADVTLVPEEVLLEKGHARHDARLAARGQRVQLQLGGDQGRGEFRVGGGAGAGAPDVGGDEVQLFAVLVGDDGTGCGAGISGDLGGGKTLVGVGSWRGTVMAMVNGLVAIAGMGEGREAKVILQEE